MCVYLLWIDDQYWFNKFYGTTGNVRKMFRFERQISSGDVQVSLLLVVCSERRETW